jgi:TolB-like protein/class 3 adenylate cyclase
MPLAREQRRLAAIVAADVVGYSRLMGRDESGTLARLREHRKQRFEPTLARHGGRLVKLSGDGALAEFPSAVDALSAAIEFQQAMAEANKDLPEDTAIVFRIGLHLGDLIVDGDDLYGDGVNVAARLEAEAATGGIVISRTVHEAVAGRLKATFDDLGSLALKNIERPVQAFGVRWEAADWKVSESATAEPSIATASSADPPLALPDKPSIAVLPFQNMSGDPDQEYFADGVVEDIITALSRFKSLFVIARNSSFTYKGKAVDIKQVGRELGVRYVLEGSVRKAAGRVRITGQLIDAGSGTHLWADRFDGSLQDVFELQDLVTASVVGSILPSLDQAEFARQRQKPLENLDAYDCVLRGRAKSIEGGREQFEEALRLARRAMTLDPSYSPAFGLIARCHINRHILECSVDAEADKAEIRQLVSLVSAKGRDDAETICWVGFALARVCGDVETGSAMIDHGLAINPNLPRSLQQKAVISVVRGEHEVAIEQAARALRFNPADPSAFLTEIVIATANICLGKYDDAVSWATRATARRSDWPPSLRAAACANALHGNLENARQLMARYRELVPQSRLSNLGGLQPLQRPQDLERMIEGLRLAGLPE